jgi:signal transduction histidine kinase
MDERDSIIGSVITFMDITLLKDFEIELRQREKLGAMGEMAISIAHEIRNPMAAIRGALEVLQEKGKLRDEGEKLIEVVFKETDRLNHIVEDFLKYAKEKELNVRYEDIWKLIDEVWLLIRQSEKWNANIKLEKKLNKARFIIKIDPDRIKQVFYNLFINSMDAMPFGGKIYVDINDIGDKTTIIVKDTGLGMPKDRLNNIFRSYYSTKKEGLGVGLKISKRIIESHKGSIELQSKEGEGTAVIIILPK